MDEVFSSMRWGSYLAGMAALLICPGGVCLGMGSGPHPTVPYGIPAPEQVLSAEGQSALQASDALWIWVLVSVGYVCVLTWAGRAKGRE